MQIPVYLFTGFLDAGKTTLICRMLEERQLNLAGQPTLLLVCEAGLKEYPQELLEQYHIQPVRIRRMEECTQEYLTSLQETSGCRAVIAELNGFWPCSVIEGNMPENWVIREKYFCADANTIGMFSSNLQGQTGDKISYASSAWFNRVPQGNDGKELHSLVRQYGRRAEVFIQRQGDDTWTPYRCEEAVPYSLEKDPIDISDPLFGVWFHDMEQQPERYVGRTVRVCGVLIRVGPMLAFGRNVTIGRMQDAEFWGLQAVSDESIELRDNCWYLITAKVEKGPDDEEPILHLQSAQITRAPMQETAILR